jgi:hypothetical protein
MRADHSAKSLFGQDFQQQRVLDAAIDDVHGIHARLGGVQCRRDKEGRALSPTGLLPAVVWLSIHFD